MSSEKQLAANRRNTPLSSGTKTAAGRTASGRNVLRSRPASQIDATKSAEQLFADLVADPWCFSRIAVCKVRIRAALRKNMRQLLDLQALSSAVLTAKTAAETKTEFAPDAQTSLEQFEDSTAQLIPATSMQRKAPLVNGFEFSNHIAPGNGQALRFGALVPRVDAGATSPLENGFEFSNDSRHRSRNGQALRFGALSPQIGPGKTQPLVSPRPSPSRKAKVIPIDSFRPPRSPTAA
jgi:hypothetical protein